VPNRLRSRPHMHKLILFIGLTVFCAVPAHAWDWIHSGVDSTGSDEGQYVSLTVDGSGAVHLGYFRYDPNSEGNRNPRYAYKASPQSGGGWALATPDGTASSGSYSSLAVAPDGTVHMAYYESEFADLRHAWKPPGQSWQNQSVDAAGEVGQYCAIAVQDGVIYISYYDATASGLKLASKPVSGGSWSFELLDTSAAVGLYTSITTYPRLTVAYFDLTNTALKVATKVNGVWQIETVDFVGDVGRYTSMAQDGENTYIAYYDNFLGNLKFADRHVDGPWHVVTLASNGDVGRGTGLSIDPSGRPHVVYYRNDTEDLLYAGRYNHAWAFDVVATGGNVGRFSDIGFSPDGYPYIAYYDLTKGTLRFAYGVGEPTGIPEPRLVFPGPVASLAPLANPSRNGAAFVITLTEPGSVTLNVFDMQGRALQTLVDGMLGAGPHAIAWNGRDSGGMPVGAGSYFVLARGPGQSVIARVTLLR